MNMASASSKQTDTNATCQVKNNLGFGFLESSQKSNESLQDDNEKDMMILDEIDLNESDNEDSEERNDVKKDDKDE